MDKYELTFTLPYQLNAYDQVTLKERLERELQSYLYDRSIKAILTEEDQTMIDHNETARFFDEKAVRKEFGLPDWPAGTEVVCYCRSTDSRDAIEQLAQLKQWNIVGYVNIEDDMEFRKSYIPGQVLLVKREIVTLTYRPIPICRDTIQQILDGIAVGRLDQRRDIIS